MSTQVETEIREQPDALARTLAGVRPSVVELAREVSRRKIEWVMIAARVSPETKHYLAEEQARTNQSLGAILDEAARVHREFME